MKYRRFAMILLAVCMMLTFTSVSFSGAQKVEVTIWHTYTDDQEKTLNEIADAFNASQDAAKVVVQSQPYQGFLDNVYTAVANGVGPNIIFNYASTAADYVEGGLLIDFGKYLDDAEIGIPGYAESMPAAIYAESCGFTDGKVHYLPAVTTGPIMFYNKTIYDSLGLTAPTTWTQLAENSKAIYDATGKPGFAVDSVVDTMQALIIQNGSGYIDVQNKKALINNDKAIERIEWYADNVKAGYFALNPTGDYWSNDFNAQLVASYLGSCAGVPYITPDGFEYAVSAMPQEGETQWYPAWNRGIIAFAKDDAADKATYEFSKFFLTPENNAKWCISMNALSPFTATRALADYQAFIAVNPALAAVSEGLPVAGSLPSIPGAYTVRVELQKAATLAASGAMTAAEALAEAEAVCDAELKG